MSCRLEIIHAPFENRPAFPPYWEENQLRYDDDEGGATQQLAEAVAALGHEVVVLSQSPEVRKLKKIEIGTLETWLSPRDTSSATSCPACATAGARKTYFHRKIYPTSLALRDFLAKRGKFDVIWAHAESPDGLIVAMAAPAKNQGAAARWCRSSPCATRFDKGTPVFIEKLPLGLAFRQASRILASSELVVTGARRSTPARDQAAEDLRAKVRRGLSQHAARLLRTRAAECARRARPMEDRVLFLGALNQAQGALVFLSALAKTQAAQRSSTFAVIGDFTEYNPRFIQRGRQAKEARAHQASGRAHGISRPRQHV